MEFMITIKAYTLLVGAVLHGESITNAGEDFFLALCYLDGIETPSDCVYYKNKGFKQGLFPMDMSR